MIPRDGLSSVPIIREFSDVFEEVGELPPQREIEFQIDLVDGARPIVMPLRRMSPKEQRNLEVQVNDLSSKGFIWGCVSEWGALVVFATKVDGS